MHGTFNGAAIKNVFALIIHERQVTVRVLGCPSRELEQHCKRGVGGPGQNFNP
jgi:hypothetical protein